MSVGADVLHWSSANRARDTAQALKTRAVAVNCIGDEAVPVVTRPYFKYVALAHCFRSDSTELDFQHQSRETHVGDNQVAAAA